MVASLDEIELSNISKVQNPKPQTNRSLGTLTSRPPTAPGCFVAEGAPIFSRFQGDAKMVEKLSKKDVTTRLAPLEKHVVQVQCHSGTSADHFASWQGQLEVWDLIFCCRTRRYALAAGMAYGCIIWLHMDAHACIWHSMLQMESNG